VQAQLEHPSVVPVFEVGRSVEASPEEASAFFTMRKVTGVPLDEILEGKRAGDPRMSTSLSDEFSRHRLLTAFSQVCLAVHYAHARGVLHRDLKPSNIMLGEFGEVYVLDWGLAKLTPEDDPSRPSGANAFAPTSSGDVAIAAVTASGGRRHYQTALGTALGTPAYMAPEQVSGRERLDARADVFALGAVLFEILTLQTLLDESAVEARIRGGDADWDARPSVRAPDAMIPPEFDRICVRATAKDTDKRYASARALHDVIEAYLNGERDQELRSKLAESLLAQAEERKQSTEKGSHDAAIRLVNRALALAPDDPRALELLVDLLKATSGESRKARDEVLKEGVERQRRAQPLGVALFTIPWLTLYPLLSAIRGVRSPWLAAVPAVGWVIAALANYIDHQRGTQDRVIYPTVFIFIAVALTAIPFGPLLVAPALAVTLVANVIIISAARNRTKTLLVACLSLIVPTLVVWAGLYDVYRFESETTIVLRSLFTRVRPFNLSIVLSSVDLLMLFSTSFFASRLRDEIEHARSANALFAWQLSKLLPPGVSESKKKTIGKPAEETAPPREVGDASAAQTVVDLHAQNLSHLLDTDIDAEQGAKTFLTRAMGELVDDQSAFPLLAIDGPRYVEAELLIEGKSTEVHRVRDRIVGRDVAIKRLRRDLLGRLTREDARRVEAAFEREALLQAHVEHPSVPPIYDLGHDAEGPWFTMKLVRGTPLSEVVRKAPAKRGGSTNATMTRHQRLTAFAQVVLAIDFAHRHRIAHASLDPSKIVLGEFGEVYVLGWSHAKRLDSMSSVGADIITTLEHSPSARDYIAPEQLESGRASERADVYSLGAILFEVAAGKPASSGARLPKELDEICAKAMAQDPRDRYPSARKLHEAIEAFLSSDRDEALRRDLAAERLARAQESFEAAKHDVAARADVLRNVGRALALAPDRGPALRMLSKLLASPPTQMPPAVSEDIRAQMFAMSRRAALPGALTYVVLFNVIFPIYCLVFGVRDWRAAIAIAASWALAAAVLAGTYRFRQTEPRLPWVAMTSALAVGMTSLIFGPYFLVPGLAITITLAYIFAVGREWRWAAVVMSAAALVVPLVSMWTHVSSALEMPGREASLATLVIRGAAYHPPLVFLVGLLLTNVANVLFVGHYSARFRDILDELEAENRAKVHALSRLL